LKIVGEIPKSTTI